MDDMTVYNGLANYSEMFNHLVEWCHRKYNSVHTGVSRVKDLFMTRNHFQQELAETLRRVEELEKELNKMKSEKVKLEKEVAFKLQQLEQQQKTFCVPAPPPPPPPPPAPPPPPITKNCKLVIKRRSHGSEEKNPKIPVDGGKLVVTAEDLKKVKLKTPGERSLKPLNNNTGTAVVQLKDLKRITLRKTQSAVSLRQVDKENLQRMVTDEMIKKRKLRRTSCQRSPGGTPIVNTKRRRESGAGLTPVMTRALRKRFKSVHTNSSDDSNSSGSNFSSPDFSTPPATSKTSRVGTPSSSSSRKRVKTPSPKTNTSSSFSTQNTAALTSQNDSPHSRDFFSPL